MLRLDRLQHWAIINARTSRCDVASVSTLSTDIRPASFDKDAFVGDSDAGENTIGAEIKRFAELRPNRAAVAASGFAPLSYRELHFLAAEVRSALRLAGFDRNARIAIAMPDGPQAALAIVAVACSAVSVPLNPRQTLVEIETCLTAVRPDAVLMIKGADSVARSASERKGITIVEATLSEDRRLGFSFSVQRASPALALSGPDEPDADAPAFILQTSGTSAEPKLVPYSHRNMLVTARIARTWYDLTPEDRCLSVSPVFYAHGLKVTVLVPLLTGGTVAFPTDPSKFDYLEWLGILKPTWYSAGPTLNRLIFEKIQSGAEAESNHSLRFITMGLAAAPPDVLEGLQRALGIPVLPCYGASEASVISSNQPRPGRFKPGTVGLPWPGSVMIVGEDARQLPPGEQGEVLVGGATVTSGYLNAPELNRTRFVNGWFKTGDIGSIDTDGFLTIWGRKDDLINRGGEKISPAEIDKALMRHPAVAEAAAFAVPHPRLGEDVAGAVVLRPGMTTSPVELREFLQQKLAPFKVPRRIVIRDQMPKGQTGKIMRRRLAELMEEDAAATHVAAPQMVEDTKFDSELAFELTDMWQQLLKTAPIGLDDDFFELGGDSLLALQMHTALEELIGRTLPRAILIEATTIRQLTDMLSAGGELKAKPVVQLHANGSQTPIFFFHSEFNGEGYSAIRLARLLGSDQPFFIVDPHGLGDDPVPHSLEAMAADRLPLILQAQSDGPYRLLGSCVGGLVAFEVARLLAAEGRKVETVVMVDPPVVSARRSVQILLSKLRLARPLAGPVIDRAMAWTFRRCADLEKFRNISWARRWRAVKNRVRRLTVGAVERSPFEETIAKRDATYEGAMSSYVPKPLSVPVIYFSVDYPGEPWRRISPDLQIIKSPGNHFDLDLADIAKHLKMRLQAAGR
jgi:oxalate---CoA ligase